ncbi:phospho-sugar mutase [Kineosporia sp. NBRC 101731]|uniref:phospho-sugar mutase n=1 Tax=Kineosporia sp. NBRC 101731 TaxID=3032199 RepID=UPI0024A1677A|nr:phospho-sugar mutase [Kineosporia sp. NBRC 101731]GLY27841.1 phosphomannomutase [Kineosporia sp. NBRC 101731]
MDETELAGLVDRATHWRDADPDPRTRREVDRLIELVTSGDSTVSGEAVDDLVQRFSGSLQFGTAGLRGALGAGPNRMNRAVVIRAAAGIAGHLHQALATVGADGEQPRVVVGYDARHDSDVFARDTCAVLTAAGCVAQLLPGPLPTPVLAFALRHLHADAGIMVTASHNPPQDNGYKVYLGGRADSSPGSGAQIVPPMDDLIAHQIAAAPPAIDVPMATDGWEPIGPSIVDEYLASVGAVLTPGSAREISIVLTPLHGVGGDTAVRAFAAAGFPAPYVVEQQAQPDPDFPTVSFPNPEEPGALDLALAAARERGADLVIANDPDADRCAVAVPVPEGDWRMLRGDEVGALLGDYLLVRGVRGVVASSIVSSQLLSRVAAAHGVPHTETLTGFKWLARVPELSYAYEEALGYCVSPGAVRDKDGISAALLIAEYAAQLRAQGRTLLDALNDLATRHGLHATDQFSVRVDDLAQISSMLDRITQRPPANLGGSPVKSAEDLSEGVDGLPGTPGLRYRTTNGDRVIVRPSGTEPKLKCYLEVVIPVENGSVDRAREAAADRLARITADVSHALGIS